MAHGLAASIAYFTNHVATGMGEHQVEARLELLKWHEELFRDDNIISRVLGSELL